MKIILFFIVFIIFFILYVRYLEYASVFYPDKEITLTPRDIGLSFDDIYFKTKDGLALNAWLVKNPQASQTVLFFHGNAGNLSNRLPKILIFHELNLNVFALDYRGYGKSEGRPSENGIYADARAAYDYLKSRDDIDIDNLIVYGASLGGVVAIDLATQRNVRGLIIDSSFTSAKGIARYIYPFVPGVLLKTKMNSDDKIKDITKPKLFIHSREDEIVPFALGMKLYEQAAQPKTFLEIHGGHNTNHEDSKKEISEGIKNFLNRLQ